jgi:multidrug transporter EmrE-like cation transporter
MPWFPEMAFDKKVIHDQSSIFRQSFNIYLLLWIVLAGLSGAIAPLIIKYYVSSKPSDLYLPILAWFIYGITIISFTYVFKTSNVSITFPIIKGLTILFVIFIGIIFFNEKTDTTVIISILLIFIALFLLTLKS